MRTVLLAALSLAVASCEKPSAGAAVEASITDSKAFSPELATQLLNEASLASCMPQNGSVDGRAVFQSNINHTVEHNGDTVALIDWWQSQVVENPNFTRIRDESADGGWRRAEYRLSVPGAGSTVFTLFVEPNRDGSHRATVRGCIVPPQASILDITPVPDNPKVANVVYTAVPQFIPGGPTVMPVMDERFTFSTVFGHTPKRCRATFQFLDAVGWTLNGYHCG
jgi:hypothetical protein